MQNEACFDSFFLKKAAEGDVSSAEFDRLADHMQGCESCMKRFDQAIFADARNFVPSRAEHLAERGPVPFLERLKAVNHWQDRPELGQRFLVIGQVGRGGMGEVYECFDKNLNRAGFAAAEALTNNVVGLYRTALLRQHPVVDLTKLNVARERHEATQANQGH